MRDFPSCFGENGVQIADASSSSSTLLSPTTTTPPTKTPQNLVTCVYHCKLHSSSCFIITITWSKTLMGLNLSIEINDPTNQSLSKQEIKTNIFSKRKGSKTLKLGSNSTTIFYDLSCPNFHSSPEPINQFYLAITINQQLILLLGDMEQELYKKLNPPISSSPNSIFVSKTEHVFGTKLYSTTAQFCGKGQVHEILIECDTMTDDDPNLLIRIDGKLVMKVKRLQWKFRGNYTILVDGLPVEVYWDVYSWFYGSKLMGNGVFLFQTCLSAERLWGSGQVGVSGSGYLGKDCGSGNGLGFSLVVFAWRDE